MLTKEYRICMPLTVEEYRIGQLYMIARHSLEQSDAGNGVEVIENKECHDEEHGKGQYTEKRIHLSSIFFFSIQSATILGASVLSEGFLYSGERMELLSIHNNRIYGGYRCSFIPKLNITILTKFEDNPGTSDNCLRVPDATIDERTIDFVDIAFDEVAAKHYKKEEDPKCFKSAITGRGPLIEGWRQTDSPVMCSYKLVQVSFEVWGLQTKVEDFVQRCIRDVLLLGHRQAFTWIDEWHWMSIDDVREYEHKKQEEANQKVLAEQVPASSDPDNVE
ncbi:cytoplasmic phosphatidylinositol transfer protein 1 isoform X1 [Armigeres subalbatus]|uniref:cytoplasmic phosphatidylinositol transfer protein 1 isoform X1 n=1 Tax=Armigeres subalbatus TaxID=124917 RepID=UPI002ED4022A